MQFQTMAGLPGGGSHPSLAPVTDVVCGVIGDGTGRVLACQRGADRRLGGFWEFPGGKVETGESPEMALVRELREELAVEVETGGRLTPVEWAGGAEPIRLIPIRCRIVAGTLRLVEHAASRWCAPGEFHTLDWAPADRPVVAEVARLLEERTARPGLTWPEV